MAKIPRSSAAAPAITRRGFFTLAAALGLSAAAEGYEGFFVRAWGDEAGKTQFRIYVAARWQVPIAFLDMSNPSDPASIVGARVTITSHYNGKSATGVTNEDGVALVSISDLSEPVAQPEEGLPVEYSFFGSVLVEAEGYRVFETGKMLITGGQQVETPTEPLKGRPYVRCASIDGWDVQYAKKTSFAATSSNRDSHEAFISIADGSGAGYAGVVGSVDLSFGQPGGLAFSKKLSFGDDGLAQASFEGKFFSTHAEDAGDAFAPGEGLLLDADIVGDDANSFTLTTAADITEGVVEDESVEDTSYSIDSFINDGASGDISYKLPESLPFLAGESVSVSSLLPSWPVSLALDPFGLLIAGVGRSGSLHRHGTKWQHDTFENSLQNYRDVKDEWTRNFNKWKSDREYAKLGGGKASKTGRLSPTKSFDMNFQCGGMVICQWGAHLADASEGFRGDAQLYAILSGGFSVTQQVTVMYVPLFVRFEATAATRAIIDVGVSVDKDTKDLSLSDGSSIAFTLQPEIALTMGLGVADLLSVGIRGAGYLSFYLNVAFQPPEGKSNPRFCVGAGVSASVVVQAALFKASVGLYSIDWPGLYDSWNVSAGPAALKSGHGVASEAPVYEYGAYHLRRADGTKGYSELFQDAGSLMQSGSFEPSSYAVKAVPVTQAELAKTAEFKAFAKQAPLLASDQAGEGDQAASPVHDLYSYSPISRERLKGAGAGSMGTTASSSVLKSLDTGGARMSSGLVYGEAFSDPRMKVVQVNGDPWLLRILTTTYGEGDAEKTLTRLAVAKWSSQDSRWEAAQVIDFTPVYGTGDGSADGPAREALYDYDFSVISSDEVVGLGSGWSDGGVVRVFLTSGTREQSAGQSMGAALAHTVGTFLSIGSDLSVKTVKSFADVYGKNGIPQDSGACFVDPTSRYSSYTCATLVYPQITSVGASEVNVTAVMAFCRLATSANALECGPYVEFPVCALFATSKETLSLPVQLTCPAWQGEREVTAAFAAERKHSVSMGVIGFSAGSGQTVYLGAHYVTESASGKVVKEFGIQALPSPDGQVQLFLYDAETSASFVYPFRGVGLDAVGGANALCAAEGKLISLGFTKNVSSKDEAVTSPVDLTLDKPVDLSAFAIDQATGMLYYATTREGLTCAEPAEDGTCSNGATVADYRIWATRCVSIGGKTGFIEPFPLIQTDEPVDSLVFVPLDGSYAFMVNSITSMENSQSDIVFYKLPYVRSVRLIDFQSVNRFVCAGETEAFEITVCNEGNVIVSGFSLLVRAVLSDGTAFEQSIELDLTKTSEVVPLPQADDAGASGVDSSARAGEASTCEFTEPSFDLATQAGMLAPGKTRSYRFCWKVPAEFCGAMDLELVVDGASNAAPVVAASENGRFRKANTVGDLGESFAHEPVLFGADVRSDNHEGENGSAEDLTWSKSRYRYGDEPEGGSTDDDPAGDPSDGPVGPGGSAGSDPVIPGGSGSGLSRTGDGSFGAVAAAAALAGIGLAGAGLAAHEIKREEAGENQA